MSDKKIDDEKVLEMERSESKPHFIEDKAITEIPMYVTYARPRWPAHQVAYPAADPLDESQQETLQPLPGKDD
jgi:hypothetical protein